MTVTYRVPFSQFTVSEDWLAKLEFKALLSNFGFEAQTAKEIGETMIDDDGKQARAVRNVRKRNVSNVRKRQSGKTMIDDDGKQAPCRT